MSVCQENPGFPIILLIFLFIYLLKLFGSSEHCSLLYCIVDSQSAKLLLGAQ